MGSVAADALGRANPSELTVYSLLRQQAGQATVSKPHAHTPAASNEANAPHRKASKSLCVNVSRKCPICVNRKCRTFEEVVGAGQTLSGWFQSGVRGWTEGRSDRNPAFFGAVIRSHVRASAPDENVVDLP